MMIKYRYEVAPIEQGNIKYYDDVIFYKLFPNIKFLNNSNIFTGVFYKIIRIEIK